MTKCALQALGSSFAIQSNGFWAQYAVTVALLLDQQVFPFCGHCLLMLLSGRWKVRGRRVSGSATCRTVFLFLKSFVVLDVWLDFHPAFRKALSEASLWAPSDVGIGGGGRLRDCSMPRVFLFKAKRRHLPAPKGFRGSCSLFFSRPKTC